MPEGISEEEFKKLQETAKKVGEEVEEERKKEPAEPITQKYPFSSEMEIEKLKMENADLKKTMAKMEETIAELMSDKIRKMKEDVENIKKDAEGLKKTKADKRRGRKF